MVLLGGLHRQKPVHVVHSQGKNLLLALLLLTDLQQQTNACRCSTPSDPQQQNLSEFGRIGTADRPDDVPARL